MIKIKLNIKKHITYILLFVISFTLSSATMILVKKRTKESAERVYSTKLLEITSEKSHKESDNNATDGSKNAVRRLKEFSPEEIRRYLSELRQRTELYQNKSALLDKKEKEIDAFKIDIENRKHEIIAMRKKLDEELILISKARIDFDSDLIAFNESEQKNLKRLADIYGSMEASKAADVLNKMKNETSAKVLASMPSKKSAKILSEINPASAATISEQIKRLQMPNRISDESFKERNIKKLATIYQQMDIERAISIIEALDNETAVSILSKMNEKRLARILELVETDEASKLIGEIREIMKKETQKNNNKNLKGA